MKILEQYKVSKFKGLNTEIKDIKSIPDGFSPDALNWITSTELDAIILRRGSYLLGATRNTGSGKITGLGVGTKRNGTQIPFFTYGRKVKYYDESTEDTVEVGSDLLPSAADGKEVSIFPYQNIAGSFVYLTGEYLPGYKIPVANPDSAVSQSLTTYKGFTKFGQGRSFMFNRSGDNSANKDKTSLYASHVDRATLANYPSQVTGEAVGSSGSTNYTHTLTQRSGTRTVFAIQVSATVAAGTETFIDDGNGVLTSNYGGTGTVNYATGAISVTFSATTTGAVTASYYYEDATSDGVLDFSFSSTRVAGEGNVFPQFDGGGNLNSVFPLATVFYCFHEIKTWQVSIPSDDGASETSISTNLPFRDKLGVKSPYGAFGGAKGIYLINTANEEKPEMLLLSLYAGATANNIAVTKVISDTIDFSLYAFDYAVVFEWGDFVLLSCQQIRNGSVDDFNSRTFLYNKKSGAWDLTDYAASRLAEYAGSLIAGDSVSNNVFTLFSGFDDDENLIPNYWTSGQTNLSMPGQKRFSRMVIEGLTQQAQNCVVQLSFDGGDWVDAFTISGDGSYVDTGASISVGSYTVGSKIAGGGQTVFANPFQVEFIVQSPRFEYVRVRFECTGGGYFQVNSYSFKDIRQKSTRVLPARNG